MKATEELALMAGLRRVLDSLGSGKGVSGAIVEDMRSVGALGRRAARMTLLGMPADMALGPLVSSGSREVALLAGLVGKSRRGDGAWLARSSTSVSAVLERWIKLRENRRLQERVMGFRGLVSGGVLGAASAMMAAMGPLLGSFDLSGAGAHPGPVIAAGAAAMSVVGSAMLGLYFSPKSFYVNPVLTVLVFAFVWFAVSPLAGFQALSWAAK